MQFSFLIARRYVFSRHSLNFITIITTISIIGIGIGVAALIVVMSVFNGFREIAEHFLVGFDPHIRISASTGVWIPNADSLQKVIARFDGVKAVSPVLSGKIIGMHESTMQAFSLQGVEPGEIGSVSGIHHTMMSGHFDLSTRDGIPHIVLGAGLADKLRVFSGDTLLLVAPHAIEAAIARSEPPSMSKVVVAGLFQTNYKEYDAFQGYTSVGVARPLLNAPPHTALHIDIRGEGIDRTESLQSALKKAFPLLLVESWYDLHKDLYNVMRFERMAAFTVLTLIILIAVFNVFASLTMTVAEKKAQIGVLKAMGAPARSIMRIFLYESLIIGVVGTALGIGLGLGAAFGQIYFGWFALDTSRYIVPAIPVSIHAGDVVFISIVSLCLSPLAGIYPARKAARVRAARTLIMEERIA